MRSILKYCYTLASIMLLVTVPASAISLDIYKHTCRTNHMQFYSLNHVVACNDEHAKANMPASIDNPTEQPQEPVMSCCKYKEKNKTGDEQLQIEKKNQPNCQACGDRHSNNAVTDLPCCKTTLFQCIIDNSIVSIESISRSFISGFISHDSDYSLQVQRIPFSFFKLEDTSHIRSPITSIITYIHFFNSTNSSEQTEDHTS